MNPQGFLPVKPLPQSIKNLGFAVAKVVKLTTGMDIPYQEGLMLIVSTIVMAVSIVIWIVIDIGNREDKRAHNAVLEMRPTLGNRQSQVTHHRRSIEVDRLERMQELSGGGAAVGRTSHTDLSEGMGNVNSYGYVQVSSSGVHSLRRRQA